MHTLQKTIVVVGEYSSVGISLKEGYTSLGYKVVHISSSDGYKGFQSAFRSNRYIDLIITVSMAIRALFHKDYFIIFLSPFVFKRPLILNRILNYFLIFRSKSSAYYSCTTDSVYWRHYPQDTDRNPLYGFLLDNDFKVHRHGASNRYYRYNLSFILSVDKVFAASEEYYQVYKDLCDLSIVRYPISILNISIESSINNGIFLHGITRPGIKGTAAIINKLEKSGVDYRIVEKVTFKEFTKSLKEAQFYIDQYNSHYPGVAALVSLQFCDLVFTGYRPDLIEDNEYARNCPFRDIRRTDAAELKNLKVEGNNLKYNLEFLRKYHNPTKIAYETLQ